MEFPLLMCSTSMHNTRYRHMKKLNANLAFILSKWLNPCLSCLFLLFLRLHAYADMIRNAVLKTLSETQVCCTHHIYI